METNNKKVTIGELQTSHEILMIQTQALCEVLRTYFETGIGGGKKICISDSSITSFLYQVDDNLERMDELVGEIVDHSRKKPAQEIKLPQFEGIQ